tara:strand:- start:160 stop:972 length:813 start_codon:yes stop_codon:yes gene_type:complete
MAWKYGSVTLKEGSSWTDDNGIKHPTNWSIWTETYKKNVMGLTWVDSPKTFDSEYYFGWNSDESALLPKPIADLKTTKLSQAKNRVQYALNETDWYITRKYERDVAIPSEISAYRTAALTNYTSLQSAINSASDIDGLKAIYETTNGASQDAKSIDATSSGVVSTSDDTITINGHGFVNDEAVHYAVGLNSDNKSAEVIGGLIDRYVYFVHSATTNTFKLSESHSDCGDAAAVNITSLSSDGTAQTFTSYGKYGKGRSFPDKTATKYDGS